MTTDLGSLQRAFAAHIRDPESNAPPEGIEDRRMAIYRELFFNNIKSFLASNFPVLRKLHTEETWQALVRRFFAGHEAHTPLFPELPREFLQFLESISTTKPFFHELAHYEWAELAVQIDEAEINDVSHDRDGDLLASRPVKSPVAWLLSYRYPVHQIRPEFQPDTPPDAPTYLVVYRRRDDKVRFMEINNVTARLLQSIETSPEKTGREHLSDLADAMGTTFEAISEAGKTILNDLRDREILLGTAPESD